MSCLKACTTISHMPAHTARRRAPVPLIVMPWSLRAWPPLLWPLSGSPPAAFHHLGTRLATGAANERPSGQTVWAGTFCGVDAGVAWDWIEIDDGIFAMADPMSVITNLRFVGDEGGVLTAWEAARYVNGIVHALPWQGEVERMLQTRH
jgi:hypothetical protein